MGVLTYYIMPFSPRYSPTNILSLGKLIKECKTCSYIAKNSLVTPPPNAIFSIRKMFLGFTYWPIKMIYEKCRFLFARSTLIDLARSSPYFLTTSLFYLTLVNYRTLCKFYNCELLNAFMHKFISYINLPTKYMPKSNDHLELRRVNPASLFPWWIIKKRRKTWTW